MTAMSLNRREFIQQTSLGAAAVLAPLGQQSATRGGAPARWKIIAFSKPFTDLSFEQTADLVADVGWDGIECPVRKTSTHIVPERVEEDLPKMVDALKKRGREVTMVTTDIVGVDRSGEQILRTAARLGIRQYRLGPIHYTADKPIAEQLADITHRLHDVAAMNASIGIRGGYENHSGRDYFGAPIWDVVQALHGLRPADLGIAFDIGHATVEGGLSWPIQARLAEPYYTVIYVKDFRWEKTNGAWAARWCPLGEGMVDKRFFTTLKASSFDGPLCQHHEYELGAATAEHIAHFKADLQAFRQWLGQ
jgi:sugar phosphate isomerase/epimerase